MTIKDMHYDFKKKLDKIDSQQYRNLLVPEIDWVLNEAYEIFVKMVSQPRVKKQYGFELQQRSIDDIREIVENGDCVTVTDNVATLPDEYWYHISSYVLMTKGTCTDVQGRVFIRQHDDEFERSPFDSTSFDWRTVNAVFFKDGVKFFATDFTITSFCLSYIRKLTYMHNAEDFRAGTYNLLSGVTLSGTQDCELAEHTHREIVDIAVLIATGELESSASYGFKQAKLNLNQLN